MTTSRRTLFGSAAAFAATCLAGMRVASAQAANDWPQRPIKLVVAFAPGGNTDLTARLLAERLAATLGQPVVVENRTGAAGIVGAESVARSAPDGYTLQLATNSTHAVHAELYRGRLPYDPIESFTPVSRTTRGTHILAVHPSVEAQDVRSLIALAKARPGHLTYGSGGNGQSSHMSAEMFSRMTGIEMLHVPFRSTAPAATALLGGQIHVMFDPFSSAFPQMRAGRIRALAVSSAERHPLAPDLPTVAETLPGFESDTWDGIFAPAGTPAPIVAKIEAAVRAALADQALLTRLSASGLLPYPGGPDEFAAFQRAEIAKWGRLIREANITAS
jgi:tripartite-type tricarboxylate transporter receptor subunit TctC